MCCKPAKLHQGVRVHEHEDAQGLLVREAVKPITSARGTVIAAEVAVKNMYHEERELLPAADGTHGKEGLLPGAGGMSSPLEPGSSLFYWRRELRHPS